MMPAEKVEQSLALIASELVAAKHPVVCCSFGKDSLVLLDLIYTIQRIPVLFFLQYPKQFPKKYAFADEFIKHYKLPVFSLPPMGITHVQDGDYFDLFTQYGGNTIGPLNMSMGCRAWKGTDKEFVCAVESLMQPMSERVDYPWDLTFIGHKAADPVPLAQHVHFLAETIDSGSTRICLPLAHWTDDDIWAYLKEREMPYDTARYDEGSEDANPDLFPVCFACLDTRRRGESVFCPVLESKIENRAQPDDWHARQKLILLQSAGYASFRVAEKPSVALESKLLAQEEQWPLWSMKKQIFEDQVFLMIEDLVDISKAPNGLARLREEWIRLEHRCAEAGITGWIAWVAKTNPRMQRCLFTTGAEPYAEDEERIWVRKFVNPSQSVFPTLKEMAVQALRKEPVDA